MSKKQTTEFSYHEDENVATTYKKQHRAWVFVINNPQVHHAKMISMLYTHHGAQYVISGYEIAPTTGTPHLQSYVYFGDSIKKTRRQLSNFLGGSAWLAPSKGTPSQNIAYCSADGLFKEYGKRPNPGKANKRLVKDILKNPYTNPHLYVQYRKAFTEVEREEHANKMMKKTRELFIYNPTLAEHIADYHDYDLFMVESHEDTIKAYNGEEVVLVMPTASFLSDMQIRKWLSGQPIVFQRGYEQHKFCPRRMYIIDNDYDQKFMKLMKNRREGEKIDFPHRINQYINVSEKYERSSVYLVSEMEKLIRYDKDIIKDVKEETSISEDEDDRSSEEKRLRKCPYKFHDIRDQKDTEGNDSSSKEEEVISEKKQQAGYIEEYNQPVSDMYNSLSSSVCLSETLESSEDDRLTLDFRDTPKRSLVGKKRFIN